MDNTMKSQFDTNQMNKVTKHITTLQTSKEFMGVWNTWKSAKSLKKWGLCKALDGTEDEVLSEECKSLDNKISNDQCNSSNKYIRGFYN